MAALTVAGEEFPFKVAQEMVLGYAFAEESVTKNGKTISRPRWGYQTYDCILASPGDELEPVDLLVAASLNGDLNVKRMASLLRVADAAGSALARAKTVFWKLPAGDLETMPDEGSPARPVWDAWEILMSAPDVDIAITHKVLHHKRPRHFPLLDNETYGLLPEKQAWKQIHEDIQQPEFRELEEWFEADIAGRSLPTQAVPLSRLRLHDILLWGSRPPQNEELQKAGSELLGGA